jgi:hypothetical protein
MMRRPAKKGDKFFEHMTSDTFNELIKPYRKGNRPTPRKETSNNTIVKAVYVGADVGGLSIFEPVVITGQSLTNAATLPDASMMQMVLEVIKVSEATVEGTDELPTLPVAVTQGFIKGSVIGEVVVAGNTWVRAASSIAAGRKIYVNGIDNDKVGSRATRDLSGHGYNIVTVPSGTSGLYYSNIILTQYEAGGGCANPVKRVFWDSPSLKEELCDGTINTIYTGSSSCP